MHKLGAVEKRKEVENKSSYIEEITVWLKRKCIYIWSGNVKQGHRLVKYRINPQEGLLGFREASAHYDLEWLEKMVWKRGFEVSMVAWSMHLTELRQR